MMKKFVYEKSEEKLYIVPGFGETTRMKNYREVIEYAQKKGFCVTPITIGWDMDKNMSDYIKEVENQIPSKNEDDTILGFSFGAYITYMISKKKVFDNYIFCTISPYFKENLKYVPQESKDYFGEYFIESLKKYSIHKGEKNNAWFLVGEKDWDLAINVNKEAEKNWKGKSKFILVEKAKHELNHKSYLKEVDKIIKELCV